MPSGYREYAGHKWPLLPQAEALGCARWGVPVLPRKQRLQRERGGQQRSRSAGGERQAATGTRSSSPSSPAGGS